MNDISLGLIAWLGGVLLGTVFFGGLLWTVRKAMFSERAALWFIISLLLRMSVTLTGFYWLAGNDWQRLLLCLLGFLMARWMTTWLTRASSSKKVGGVGHASES